jgi:hypothetical protein
MRFVSSCVAAVVLGAALSTIAGGPFDAGRAFAQAADQKAPEQKAPDQKQPADAKDKHKKADEYAEAERVIGGPAANPECMWLGKNVVNRLWQNDLDTAFRQLDLYDRFGCPAGHLQVAFRCVLRLGNPDKSSDTMNARVHACWLNPSGDPVISPPASAAAASPAQAQ